jgi:hypothetical protein
MRAYWQMVIEHPEASSRRYFASFRHSFPPRRRALHDVLSKRPLFTRWLGHLATAVGPSFSFERRSMSGWPSQPVIMRGALGNLGDRRPAATKGTLNLGP